MSKAGRRELTSLFVMSTPAKSADWVCLFACLAQALRAHIYDGHGPPRGPPFIPSHADHYLRGPPYGVRGAAWQLLDTILSRTRTAREKPAACGQKLRKMPMNTTGCRVFTSLFIPAVPAKSAVWAYFLAPWFQHFDNAGKLFREGAA